MARELPNSNIGISPEVREGGRSEGDRIGDGGSTSRRAAREGDEGGGRRVDCLVLVVMFTVDILSAR